ncbi:DUF3572 family protein [Rhodobacter capsulatus]|uniref:DUF3572 family protein n=1 Tax=Rhodobacter capsulatus TaxID=1061 RepID=UPI0040282A28
MAQILAIRALGWMAGEEAVWLAFLGASGADAAQVRAEAAQPAMQRAVLAHLLREDDWVRSLRRGAGGAARRAGAGGGRAGWRGGAQLDVRVSSV